MEESWHWGIPVGFICPYATAEQNTGKARHEIQGYLLYILNLYPCPLATSSSGDFQTLGDRLK